jgi:hypothetical protein
VGQEILYCNKCGTKLVGDDFTRGRAHTFNNRQYCATCVPQSITSGAQPALKEPPRPADRSQITSQGRLKAVKPATARATPSAAPAPAPSSTTILLVGLAVIAAIVVIIYVVRTNGTSDPAPEPLVAKPPPAPAPKPEPLKPVPPAVTKEKIAKDLQELEAKVQPALKNEQFSVILDLLEEARKRLEAPEWQQGVSKLIKEAQDKPTTLYGPLKEQASAAQLRGALPEVQQARARIAGWNRKDLLDDFDKAVAAIVPREPLPPGATVLAVFPNGDMGRYRYTGEQKNGVLLGITQFDSKVVGIERGSEIFKVPAEGEVRVTFTTTSTKPVSVILRAVGSDGKNLPYHFYAPSVEVGRPQVFKAPISRLENWDNQLITPGSLVDNLFVRQEDTSAVLTIYEWVVFKTKD